jgi:hypothetical protein
MIKVYLSVAAASIPEKKVLKDSIVSFSLENVANPLLLHSINVTTDLEDTNGQNYWKSMRLRGL